MLGAYDIRYMPHIAIKGQVVADFVAKFTENMIEDGNEKIEVKMVLASVLPLRRCIPTE